MTPGEIVGFWKTVGEAGWFAIDSAVDNEIRRRFKNAWHDARAGKLESWEESAEGALALLLLLDQFPRNMFRGSAEAYLTDEFALAVAERSLAHGFDVEVPDNLRVFFYLPFMHSEIWPTRIAAWRWCPTVWGRGA